MNKKLDEETIAAIRRGRIKGYTLRELAELFDVSTMVILYWTDEKYYKKHQKI